MISLKYKDAIEELVFIGDAIKDGETKKILPQHYLAGTRRCCPEGILVNGYKGII